MKKRVGLQILLVVAVILAASWAIFRRTLYSPPAPPAAPRTVILEQRGPDEALVMAVIGDVQRSGPQGAWRKVAVGERLHADDSLRTTRGARTDLAVGDRSRLTLTESSQVTIRELTEKVHRFKLTRGRIAVDYQPDGNRVLRVESEGSDAVAETRAARFSVLSTGTAVAIATDKGDVDLTAHDKTVRVPAGQQAVVLAGAAPSPAEPIPAKLLLKVANAAPPQQELCADVDGVAAAGVEVLVDGAPAPLGPDGRFRVRVPRAVGKKDVRVVERDAMGREQERTIACAESAAHIKDFAIRWHRKKAPP